MWGRHKKLKEWLQAEVIAEAQVQAIEAYEAKRGESNFGRGLTNLSIFAILVGVLSIIAYNWYKIPGEVKIGVHVLLNAIIAALSVWADRKGRDVWREAATLAFMGLTMTLIILVGQVFQLTGDFTGAVTFWIVITLPFFLLMGRTESTAAPWTVLLLVAIGMNVSKYVPDLSEEDQAYFYIGLPALLPLAFMADGAMDIFRRWRPALASIFLRTGALLSVVCASAAVSVWGYIEESSYRPREMMMQAQAVTIMAAGLAALGLHAFLFKFYKDRPELRYGALFALVGLLLTVLPFIFPYAGNGIFSAILFITYWVFVGWLGHGIGHMRVVSLAITVIAIRIYGIYLELFGTLLTTGLGLIIGGVVMLAMIYATRKLNTHIRAKGQSHGAV